MYNPRNIRYARGGGLPQYGFGDWLGSNAGTIGTVAGGVLGGAIGSVVAPGAGTMAGASLGSSIGGKLGGGIQEGHEGKESAEMMADQSAYNNNLMRAQASIQPNQNIQGTQSFRAGGDLPDIPTAKSKNIQIPYTTDTGRQFWPMKPTADIIRDTANYFPIGVGDNQEPIFGTYDENMADDSLRYKSKLDENNKVFHPSSLLRKFATEPPTEQFLQSQPKFDFPGFANGGPLDNNKDNGKFITYEGQGHNGPNGGIPVDKMGNPSVISGENPVGLTENKESTFDGYVFSEELKPDGKKSFSDIAKALNKKYYG